MKNFSLLKLYILFAIGGCILFVLQKKPGGGYQMTDIICYAYLFFLTIFFIIIKIARRNKNKQKDAKKEEWVIKQDFINKP